MSADSARLPGRAGIRARLLAAAFVVLALGCGVIAAHSGRVVHRLLRAGLEARVERLAAGLAQHGREAVFTDDVYRQLPRLLGAASREPEFAWAGFYSPEGRLLAQAGSAAAADVLGAEAPVLPLGPALGGPPGRVVVRLWAGRTRRAAARMILAGLAVAGGVCLGGLAAMGLLLRRFLAPVERIVRADAAVRGGDPGSGEIPAAEFPHDEFGLIMRSRAEMLSALRVSEAQARALAASEGRRAAELERALAELREARAELTSAEKLSALGRVLAGVAHELNNPLCTILGFAQLLKEDPAFAPLPGQRADIESILACARRCQRIVSDLCSSSRSQPPRLAPARLQDVVSRCLALEGPRLDAAGISVAADLPEDFPPVPADAIQVEQVVMNLLINARHALEGTGGGTLSVRLRAGAGTVRLEVEDDGPGVSAEDRERVFEPFFTTKPLGKGTGLGLAIVRGIAQRHGGEAGLEDPPGGGARFFIELPLAGTGGEAAAPPEAPAARPRPLRVLVVDDDELVRRVLGQMLLSLGHRADLAADAAAALRLLARGRYDCVLADVRMPGMDGLALIEAAERAVPGLRRRWAFVTGSVDKDTSEAVGRTGAPTLQKPFAKEELAAILKTVTGREGPSG